MSIAAHLLQVIIVFGHIKMAVTKTATGFLGVHKYYQQPLAMLHVMTFHLHPQQLLL